MEEEMTDITAEVPYVEVKPRVDRACARCGIFFTTHLGATKCPYCRSLSARQEYLKRTGKEQHPWDEMPDYVR
jgi:hypothetical protein